MRYLFCPVPAHDHILEIAPTASKVKERGHEVAFTCPQKFQTVIESLGFDFIPSGVDWIPSAIEESDEYVTPDDMAEMMKEFMCEHFCGSHIIDSANQVQEVIYEWNPDFIVRDSAEFASFLAAEKLKLPHISVGVVDYSHMFQYPEVLRALDKLRTFIGLEPDPTGERMFAYQHINFMPPLLAGDDLKIPNVKSFRVDDAPPSEVIDPELVDFENRTLPLVYVSFGTAASTIPEFIPVLREIVEALSKLEANFVVSEGIGADWTGRPIFPRPHPSTNVRFTPWAPQASLLRVVDAIVTHAGPSSIRQSILAGVPILAVPLLFDAFELSDMIVEAGAGLSHNWNEEPAHEIRPKLERILFDKQFKTKARHLQLSYLSVPGFDVNNL